MKKITLHVFKVSLLLCCAIVLQYCSGNTNHSDKASPTTVDQFTAGMLYEHLEGKNYAVYLPKSYHTGRKYPVILLLDPHGDPQLPMKKYSTLADEFGYILMGPYDFKNGLSFEASNSIVRSLIADATTILPGDGSSITLCGFSGGAKAALAATSALSGISNVVYCGAAFPPGTLPLALPSLGVTGLADMNFSEVLYFTTSLDTSQGIHTMLVSHQKHEWPDTVVFRLISGWTTTQHCRISRQGDSAAIVSSAGSCMTFINSEKDEIVRDLLLHFYTSAYDGLISTQEVQERIMNNTRSAAFRKKLDDFKNKLNTENEVRQQFQDAFYSKDLSWWSTTISSLKRSKSSDSDQRLIGYISLGCYTLSRHSIDGGDRQSALKFLELYKMDDPENSEWAFLWACLDEQQGNRSETIQHLQTAVALGLNDKNKLLNERWLSQAVTDPQIKSMLDNMR